MSWGRLGGSRLGLCLVLSVAVHVYAFRDLTDALASQGSVREGHAPEWVPALSATLTDVTVHPLSNVPSHVVTPESPSSPTAPPPDLRGPTSQPAAAKPSLAHQPVIVGSSASVEQFYDPKETQVRARPLEAPDMSQLTAPAYTYEGQVARLRVFVNQDGKLVRVTPLPGKHGFR